MSDTFRPTNDPARAIYDAFQRQAKNRRWMTPECWMRRELEAVWLTASVQAKKLGLREPTLDEVKAAEQSACGHIDYGSKWAYRVVEFMESR